MGQEIFKMSLEHLAVPESKQVFFKNSIDGVYVKGTQKLIEKASNSQSWNNLSNKIP